MRLGALTNYNINLWSSDCITISRDTTQLLSKTEGTVELEF